MANKAPAKQASQERVKKQRAFKRGLWAELRALIYFRLSGYRQIARRFKRPVGEIDLIVRRGNQLVFVEVKARRSLDEAAYSIYPKQQLRIRNAARAFVAENPRYQNFDMRFDALLVAGFWRIRHIAAAWQ